MFTLLNLNATESKKVKSIHFTSINNKIYGEIEYFFSTLSI